MTTLTVVLMAGCGGNDTPSKLPTSPTPPPPQSPMLVTASAYIMPEAVRLGDGAFGKGPLVIYKGERLRWVNADALAHVIVADSADATDFPKTDELRTGDEQSFIMNKLGTTRLHCAIHPSITGTLIVREH